MSYRRAKLLDKNLIFAEYFNSEQEVRRNGGVPTDVAFDKGKATGNGTSSFITYQHNFQGVVSVRFKINHYGGGLNRVAIDFRGPNLDGTGWIQIGALDSEIDTSNVTTRYINGVQESGVILSNEDVDVVVTGLDVNGNWLYLLSNITPASFVDGSLELVEIYNKALTAEEVSNLYNDARYSMPVLEHGEQLGEEMATGWNTQAFWNNTFASNWSVVNGELVSNGNTGFLTRNSFWDTSKKYYVSITVEWNSGAIYLPYGGSNASQKSASGTYTYYITPTPASALYIYSNVFNGKITALSIKEVIVEPTSKILHFTARDGVARNLLSGSYSRRMIDSDKGSFENGTDTYLEYGANVYSIEEAGAAIGNKYLKVTYGDNATAFAYYITSNGEECVAGLKYHLKFRYKTSGGTVSYLRMHNGTTTEDIRSAAEVIRDGEWHSVDYEFTAQGTVAQIRFWFGLFASGETIGIDGIDCYEIIPEVTNTAIEVAKDGQIRVPRFNGSTSKIDCGSYSGLTGDITIAAMVNPKTWSSDQLGTILNNGQILVEVRGTGTPTNGFRISSNASTVAYSANNVLSLHDWYFIVITRTASGIVNLYVDGVLTGSADQNSGTPAAGTTNILIGERSGGDRELDGKIGFVTVLSGLLTTYEISQWWTSIKKDYAK